MSEPRSAEPSPAGLPDVEQISAELGLPPVGSPLTREQSLRFLRALWGEPDPEIVARIRARGHAHAAHTG